MGIDDILKSLVPDPEECRHKAERLRAAYPGLSSEKLAEKAVGQAKKVLAATGAVGGAVANPVAMVPAALGEMGIVLKQEANLTGVVAALLEPNVLNDQDAFAADVLGILFPAAASQALGQIAVRAGQVTSRTLIRKYISKDVLKSMIKFSAKYLGIKVTQKAILTKAVPVVGIGVGAIWNWVEVKAIGKRAIRYYRGEDIGAPPSKAA